MTKQPKHKPTTLYPHCPVCGKPVILNKRRTTYYCSDACRQKAYRDRRTTPMERAITRKESAKKAVETKRSMDMHVTCVECERSFMVDLTRAATQYCSAACKQKAYRRRLAEKAAYRAELEKTAEITSWFELPAVLVKMGNAYYAKHGFNWQLIDATIRIDGQSCFLDTMRGEVIYFQNRDQARSFLAGYVANGRPNYAALRQR